MIVIGKNVYVRKPQGYAKCTLHKKMIRGREVFSLEETASVIKTLPDNYSIMTLPEIIAKFGHAAVDDDKSTAKEEKGKEEK